jgi:hypothetical protein
MLMFRVTGVGGARARIDGLADRASDIRPALRKIRDEFADVERQHFASGGGNRWPPLAAATLRDKRLHGYPARPLVRTGDLLASLTSAPSIEEIRPRRLRVGTNLYYARFVNKRRPLIAVTPEFRRRAVAAVNDHLTGGRGA